MKYSEFSLQNVTYDIVCSATKVTRDIIHKAAQKLAICGTARVKKGITPPLPVTLANADRFFYRATLC